MADQTFLLGLANLITSLEWNHFAPLASVLCIGVFVQSAAGFGAGLLVVPLLLWAGYELPSAMAAMLAATIPQNLWGVWSLRDQIRWPKLLMPALARVAFIPLGVFTLGRLQSVSPVLLRQIVGGVVLTATMAMVLLRVKPRKNLPIAWALIAFPVSGFMQGIVGMGGPALVLWVQAHDWSTRRSRGFLFAMYTVALAPALLMLYLAFGNQIVSGCIWALVATPMLWVCSTLGLSAGSWLGRHRLRNVTTALLIAIGISGLLAPWLRGV